MKSLHLRADGAQAPALAALELPFLHAGATATDADRSRAPKPELARAVTSLQTRRPAPGSKTALTTAMRRLTFVVGGEVEVTTPHMRATLGPGDVLFVDSPPDGATETYLGDAHLIDVHVTDEWAPGGSVPPRLDEERRTPDDAPTLLEMYVEDDRANLRELTSAFPASGESAAPQGILALSFMCLSPASFGDWHTETNTSLVIGLSGGFELEVGGVGGSRVLGAGDVCVVRDDHGQGHISRTHGETRFAAIVLPPDHGLTGAA